MHSWLLESGNHRIRRAGELDTRSECRHHLMKGPAVWLHMNDPWILESLQKSRVPDLKVVVVDRRMVVGKSYIGWWCLQVEMECLPQESLAAYFQ